MLINYIASSAEDREVIRLAIRDVGIQAAYSAPDNIAAMRATNAALLEGPALRKISPQVLVTPETLAGVPCERLRIESASADKAILFLHGGGFVRGSLDLGRPCAAGLAELAQVQVYAVGYRQAPEHPYPAARNDVRNAYLALLERGFAPEKIIVVGESAGGCLAFTLPIDLQQQNLPVPGGVAGICPVVDIAMRGASWEFNSGKDVITKQMGLRMYGLYISEDQKRQALASPTYHHFNEFPPIFIGIGTHELAISDAEYLALKADEAGVEVTFNAYDAMPHSFTRYDLSIGARLLADVSAWCGAIFNMNLPVSK